MLHELAHMFSAEAYYGDILVWLLVTRSLFTLAASVLMFIEPRHCGGYNRSLHYILGILLFTAAYNSLNRASLRLHALLDGTGVLQGMDLLFGEILVVIMMVVLVGKLGYDYVVYRERLKTKMVSEGGCPHRRVQDFEND